MLGFKMSIIHDYTFRIQCCETFMNYDNPTSMLYSCLCPLKVNKVIVYNQCYNDTDCLLDCL